MTDFHPNRGFAAKAQVDINPESFNTFNISEIKGYISGCNGDMYVLYIHSVVFYPRVAFFFQSNQERKVCI